MDVLTFDIYNLRAGFNSFRVFSAQPTSTTTAYASPAHTLITSMMTTPSSPCTDHILSSSSMSSSSWWDPHFPDVYHLWSYAFLLFSIFNVVCGYFINL